MEIAFWHWLVFGFILCILEIVTPGFYIFFFGLAALVTGVISLILPELPFTITGILFVFFAVAFCFFGRKLYKKTVRHSEKALNRRSEQYIGQSFKVFEDMAEGKGKAKVGDTLWPIRADRDFKAGDSVKVKAVEGIYLIVE